MSRSLEISLGLNLSIQLNLVEGGLFMMGDEKGSFSFEKPERQVAVHSFYMCKYPITQQIWEGIMGENPSSFKGDHRPVEQVSWLDVKKFIGKLNEQTGEDFRLPSESEWEYAARGGQYSQGYQYSGSDKLSQVGWYDDNSNSETKEVGQLLANELGLHDMSGNVWEWCEDDWHGDYVDAPKDGTAWIDQPRGAERVLRGGSFFGDPIDCRRASRSGDSLEIRDDSIGVRLVLPFYSME